MVDEKDGTLLRTRGTDSATAMNMMTTELAKVSSGTVARLSGSYTGRMTANAILAGCTDSWHLFWRNNCCRLVL